MPEYIDRIWDSMEAIGTRPIKDLNTAPNRYIFKKGMLILAEAKVCFAQGAHVDKPDEDLKARNLYSEEEFLDHNTMAPVLPLPLVIYLECLGNIEHHGSVVTPVPAKYADEASSGACMFVPRQLSPLLRVFKAGIPIEGPVHAVATALDGLPEITWEEFEQPGIESAPPIRAVCLTKQFTNF